MWAMLNRRELLIEYWLGFFGAEDMPQQKNLHHKEFNFYPNPPKLSVISMHRHFFLTSFIPISSSSSAVTGGISIDEISARKSEIKKKEL